MSTIISSVHKLVPASELDKKQDKLVSGENIQTINGTDILSSGNLVINPTINHLPWNKDVATTRKQVPAGMRKKGVKISYNNASGVYIVEQYQSEDISDEAWGNDDNWKGCRTPLTPLFESGGADFIDEVGKYLLNGLYLTESEILEVYNFTYGVRIKENEELKYQYTICKTNFPPLYGYLRRISNCRVWDSKMIVLNLVPKGYPENSIIEWRDAFVWYNVLIRKVIGIIRPTSDSFYTSYNYAIPTLEEIKINGISKNFNKLAGSPKITLDSWKYIIDTAINKEVITIPVHPITYSYLMGTAEPTEQVGGTSEEWQALVTLATEKQITFTTE